MRICLVSPQPFLPHADGGADTVVPAGRAFAAAGHDTHVLTLGAPERERLQALLPGVQVHVAECDEGPARLGAVRNEPMRWALAVHHTLTRLQARHPFALVEFSSHWGGGAFALRAKRTLGAFASTLLAVRLQGAPGFERDEANRLAGLDLDQAYTQHQESLALREADLVLSSTRFLLDRVEQRLGLRRPGLVLPCPFVPPPLPPPAAEPPGRARLLFPGPLEYRALPHLFVDAGLRLLEAGREVELVLLGEDTPTGPSGQSMRAWLERRIPAAWREHVRFEPGHSAAGRQAALAAARVCCAPTPGDDLPEAFLEAMALGIVVVASAGGGLAEFIEDGTSGRLFAPGDVGQLAGALTEALDDPALRRTVREAAPRVLSARCAPEPYVARMLHTLEGLPPALAAPVSPSARDASPAVSVLVPYFNMGRFLPETLRSLREQTFEDYEILLVDDGSTDPASQALLERLEGTPRLRLVRKPNGGLSSARNAGLRQARGRWVLPLDADDLLAPTFLEKTVAVMRREPRLGYVTSLVSYFTEEARQPTGGWVPWGLEPEALCLENVASTCTALMARERLEEVGGYDEELTSFEDWDVFCGLAERGYEGLVIPEFLFHYRQRPDSMTRQVATRARGALISTLLQKHPELPTDPQRVLRLHQGEMQRLRERLAQAGDKPLRYRLVDSVNDTVKQHLGFVHRALRHTAEPAPTTALPRTLVGGLQRLSARLRRKPRPVQG